MRCPYCGFNDSKVVDSRINETNDVTRRRRECLECNRRFTTFEKLEEIPLTIIKKNGEREPFSRTKLLNGVLRALVKRQVAREQVEQIVDDIEANLRNEFKNEVESKELGDRVLKVLRQVDKVAYIRFASVYKEFKDLEEFTQELKNLK
ncbi:MAG: transcriptional regulator NrdR [Candidatus Aquicultor secundus]|uniref:Transcriptional repressor NrdR n=1 Tax=Candidatus Aquicultor secundus TaxID=1973895 RepID=A0A2M7T9J2_9ACTN|nr:transcriptional regulator NrdR [Candidatus Aquicultor secundus]NCO65137.1 transcriptional repressor NrdR [Solirubrobacter sp.]OIO87837.1 MAG: transcriptional regulator NrdR [Candidatus Aquicultor secundus]PIU27873.1 MAG: transcriptional regulator NrdR [Candidatus Aquicultor secundus]PIW22023.1 MAG: transcriptional regulator NrdR [Candidatus Aquicultor secundus]PIX52239.1 MAG: transcriptional regulator NrdR [Candidatus Aquicultor secundus]